MVVAVKEGQRLLLEEQKASVQQLQVLCQIVQVVENDQGLGPAACSVADGIEDTFTDNGGEKLLNEECQKDTADDCQVKVVDQEESPQLERFPLAHQLSPAEDDGIVDDDEDACLLERGHWSDAWLESKVVGGIAHYILEGLVEVRPQFDAKRAVERGERELLVEGHGACGRHLELLEVVRDRTRFVLNK